MSNAAPASDPKALRKLVTLTPELAWRVDEFRWGSRIGSESEALRQIIKAGLDALSGPTLSRSGDAK